MRLTAQSKLYFLAAMLFVIAAAIGLFDRGVEIKTAMGLVMAGTMVALRLKSRGGRAA